ncbi:MAG TPA: ABC transporter permease [Blastocatellia bacterium]|nr:ABC transporter permease [Blastocatellia bacterium]
METLIQDLRLGLRAFLRYKSITAMALIALALGIGANTAIFTVVNAVLLRPLPYQEPDRLVTIWEESPERGMYEMPVSFANFRDWVDQNHVFEEISAYSFASMNLIGAGEPERFPVVRSSANLFSMLGAKPMLGRTFLPEEDKEGANRVVILSERLWQRRFGAAPGVVDQALTLNNQSYTVVGVMPAGFQFPVGFSYLGKVQSGPIDLYIPLAATSEETRRGNYSFFSIGRLKDGVTLDQARAEMTTIEGRLEQQYPDTNPGIGISLVGTHEQTTKDIRPALLVLLGAVGFLLLIACANIANLLIARAAARQKEFAIRSALGASRMRILRLLLAESVLLSLAGGGLGLLLALWTMDAMIAVAPDIPRLDEVALDARVFGFALAVSLATGIVSGLIPAIQASTPNLNETLKEGSRGSMGTVGGKRIRSLLVVAEVALSFVLLIGAGLMIKSFLRLQQMNLGFNPDNVLAMNISLPPSRYPEARQQAALFKETLDRIQSLPGVRSAGVTTGLPLMLSISGSDLRVEGRPEPEPGDIRIVYTRSVSPRYFETLAIPFVKGRDFSDRDDSESLKVAIINENLARIYFPDEEPIGKRITFDDGESWMSIIGVIGDVKQLGLDSAAQPEVYWPYAQTGATSMSLVVRTATGPAGPLQAVKTEIQAVDKDLPVSEVKTMEELLAESVAGRRFNMLLLTVFAGVALVLAAVGIYGVISYSVTQRTHEIGIRMALGARGSDVLKLVGGSGLLLALAGVAIGVVASLLLTRLMSTLLFEVTPTDPGTFAVVAALLIGVALAACLVPARRAVKVDPMVALRYE